MDKNAETLKQSRTLGKRPNSVRDEVLSLYRNGYTQEGILDLGKSLPRSRTEQAPRPLAQSTISRWITKAKEADPDLEIWHLLNRRKQWPGLYTNWKPVGQIILGPFYDRLTETMYLGPGMDFFPLGTGKPPHIVRRGPKWQPPNFKMKDSDAAGPYLAELRSLGYSQRDLIRLWKRQGTKQAKLDKSLKVQELVRMIRQIRPRPFGLGTINMILKTYQHIDDQDVQVRVQEHVL